MIRVPKSLRWRLQLWYGVLLVAVLSGFGFTAFHLERARSYRRIDDGLQLRVSTMVSALRGAPPRPSQSREPARQPAPEVRLTPAQAALFGAAEGYYFAVWMRDDRPVASSADAPTNIPKPDPRDAVTRTRGDLRESFLFAAPVDCVLVGRSIAAEQHDLRTLGAWLSAAGGAVLAAGLLGGWWLATRAIRPIEDISATAEKIAAGDLSQRIADAETDSELGRLAAVLNATFARLDAAFSQQARFTADAAHELRTPVSVILTQTQSILTRERTALEYRETVEACQRAAQRMRRLIESLLALARFDAGQETLHLDSCDLARITGDCVDLTLPLATARHIAIHRELSTAVCHGDAGRLAQVVTNLLDNAIAYNIPGGEIRVTTKQDARGATLAVSNTGPGIPANDLPSIFNRFHRADASRTGGGHSGLGLAIVEAILTAHGGTIEVASTPDAATIFTVRLPS